VFLAGAGRLPTAMIMLACLVITRSRSLPARPITAAARMHGSWAFLRGQTLMMRSGLSRAGHNPGQAKANRNM
jgi:hypothetical protein